MFNFLKNIFNKSSYMRLKKSQNGLFHGVTNELDYIIFVLIGKLTCEYLNNNNNNHITFAEFHKILCEFAKSFRLNKNIQNNGKSQVQKYRTKKAYLFMLNHYNNLFIKGKFNKCAEFYKNIAVECTFKKYIKSDLIKIPYNYSLNLYCRKNKENDYINYLDWNNYCLNWIGIYEKYGKSKLPY